jgi:hypothetical protein
MVTKESIIDQTYPPNLHRPRLFKEEISPYHRLTIVKGIEK